MLVLKIMLGIVYMLACGVALLGAIGVFSLLFLDSWRWYARVGVWLASLAALSTLIAVAQTNQWGLFAPGSGCSRSRPCLQVQQPTPTVTAKIDIPGAPTGEDCRAAVQQRQKAGELPANAVVVAECS